MIITRVCCLLVLLFGAREATAATILLQGEEPPHCVNQSRLEAAVQVRLGRKLSQLVDGPYRIVVVQRREAKAFVADLTLDNAEGKVVGRRRLSITTDDCSRFRDHLVLVLSLALDPDALAIATAAPESAPSSDDAVPTAEVPSREATTPPPSLASSGPSPASTKVEPASFGSGPRGIVVYPALLPDAAATRLHPEVASNTVSMSLSRKLSERLGEHRQLTVVLEPTGFGDSLHTESALRHIATNQWPQGTSKPLLPGATSAASPDYVLVPALTELVLTDGLDYSQAKQINVVVASGSLTLKIVNRREQRALPSMTVSSAISYGGSKQRGQDALIVTNLVMDDLVSQAIENLREYDDFRRRLVLDANSGSTVTFPKSYNLHAGDGYAFVDSNGKLSGYATLHSIEPGRARLSVKSNGAGDQLVEVSDYSPWTAGVHLTFGSRLAYQRPTASDLARAETESSITPSIGADAELGLLYSALYQGKSADNWRGMVGLRWAFIGGITNGFLYELQGGLGYEFAALPFIGLAATPYVQPGILYIPGGLGADEGRSGRLTSLLAGTVSTGLQLELYRWLGYWSPTLSVEAELVMPWLHEPSANAFLDHRFPQLHGLFVSLGAIYRKDRFDESP